MNLKFLILILLLSLSLIATTYAQQFERTYQPSSFPELFTDPQFWNGKYISIYGYYDKSSNLLKETNETTTGLIISLSPKCYDFSLLRFCRLDKSTWMRVNGLFTYDGGYNLEADSIFSGKDAGYKCTSDDECYCHLCLFCPGMKMILPGYLSYEDLPENAITINFSVRTPEEQRVSVLVVNPAPNYGYCACGVLQPYGPPSEEFEKKVHQAYVDNTVLEPDEPFLWISSGYCIGKWNDNKYEWVRAKPGDEKYLNWIKDALTRGVETVPPPSKQPFESYEPISEQYFDEHVKLLSLTRNKIVPKLYRRDIIAGFEYSVGEYDFKFTYDIPTHRLVDRIWIETNESTFKLAVLSQQKLQEIYSLMSKEEAFNKLKRECLPKLKEIWVEFHVDGSIAAHGQQVISWKENKCKSGSIDLQTGEITKCGESRCSLIPLDQLVYKSSTVIISQTLIYIVVCGVTSVIIVLGILLRMRKG